MPSKDSVTIADTNALTWNVMISKLIMVIVEHNKYLCK